MSKMITYVLTFVLVIFSLPALSANVAFLYDTPAQYFNTQDWKMLETTADYALNKLPNGNIAKWQNPKTGNSGLLEPLNTIQKYGTTCRALQITNYAKYRKDQYVFMFCKFKTGWKIPSQRD